MENTKQTEEKTAAREYIAFISYRHKPLDKQAAERIQKAIERYTVPKELREKVGGKRLGMVFRDEDELPISSSLSDSIIHALDHSKYLIVICTPDLPKSPWCEQEIRYFTQKYGRDRVIAVLADGDPAESFSPLMLHTFDEEGNITGDTEPLAANIGGKDHTIDNRAFRKEIVRIYASLLGVPFDTLWQRERRRKMNRLFALFGAAILLLAGFSAYVLSKNAQISAQNKQITAQNEQIVEQNAQITKQYDQISEQNDQITQQNATLQRQLSSMQVDAGYSALKEYDVRTALQNGLDALIPDEGGEELYDRRVRALFADALGAYDYRENRTVQIYRQNVPITQLLAVESENKLLVVDEVGVVRCIGIPDGELLWQRELHYTASYDKRCEVLLSETNELVLCKGPDFVEALSLEDGQTLWRYDYVGYGPGYDWERGNGLRGLSPDGKTLVLLDGVPEREAYSILIALDTANGEEIARIDLAAEDRRILAKKEDEWFYNTADFSEDGKRLALAIFSEKLDENGEPVPIGTSVEHRCDYYMIDTQTWEILQDGYLGGFYDYGKTVSYGCVFEPETYNLFCAQYRGEFGGIIINTMDWENEVFETNFYNQTIPTEDGFFSEDPYFVRTVPAKGAGDEVIVACANRVIRFERSTGESLKAYEYSDAILDMWWNDDIGQRFTVLLASGVMATLDIEMGYESQDYMPNGGVKRAQAFSNGIINQEMFVDSSEGSVVSVLREDPGSILLTEKHTNEGFTEFPYQPDADDYYTDPKYISISPSGNRLFTFFSLRSSIHTYKVVVCDPVTLEELETAELEFDGTPCVIDDTHFMANNVIYGLDGSEELLKPQNGVPQQNFDYRDDCESRILYTGQVLTVSEVLAGDSGMTYCWLDGTAIELDWHAGYSTTIPQSGGNGLVVAVPKEENADLAVLDALSGELSSVADPYPLAEKKLLAIGTEKRIFVLSDGTQITMFDLDGAEERILDYGYNTGEIQDLCITPGDEYLLVLTVSGKLECWELSTDTRTFSDTYTIYSSYSISCSLDQETSELYVYLKSTGYGSWIGIDLMSWTVFAQCGGGYTYLPQNHSMVEFHGKLVLQEIYPVEKLAEMARGILETKEN